MSGCWTFFKLDNTKAKSQIKVVAIWEENLSFEL
jgi:hypothetical protein